MRPGTLAGLPQGQENSGKTKKMTKVRKKVGLKKKIQKKKKRQVSSDQIYKVLYFLKPSKGKKLTKKSLKSG